MPMSSLDAFVQLAGWQALQPDGVTPSTDLTITEDTLGETPAGDHHSLMVAGSTGAQDHIARRSLPATDLGDFDELRLVLQGDRRTTGGFYLELRLGSAALPIGAPGNAWHRHVPVSTGGWEVVRLSLIDLPPAVRSAVTMVQLQCIDAGADFTLRLDEALAVRPRMLPDLEQALFTRLHQQTSLSGNPVPAERVVAGGPWPVTSPCVAIVPLELRHLAERGTAAAHRCDFTADGYRIRSGPVAYEASYAIEPMADDRGDQAELMEFLLRALPPRGSLRVAANAWSFEMRDAPAVERDPSVIPAPRQRLYCHVAAWQDSGATSSVQPVQGLVTHVEWKESGHG